MGAQTVEKPTHFGGFFICNSFQAKVVEFWADKLVAPEKVYNNNNNNMLCRDK